MQSAAVFPGQGSQYAGMGASLAERHAVARETYAEADAALGFALSEVCWNGPEAELKATAVAQPALLTTSVAWWRVLAERGEKFDVVAGHSLGEYSALVAAGALEFGAALRLVRRRGELMAECAEANPGGMAAIIGMADADVEAMCAEVAAEHGTLVAANYNSPGQVVVSGVAAALGAVREAATARGGRALPLPVSGAFHSPLMAEAAEAFAGELAGVAINSPVVPVVQNVTGVETQDAEEIRTNLARQITGAVRWTQSVRRMADLGVMRYVEVGAKNVLTGLIKRTLEGADATAAEAMGL